MDTVFLREALELKASDIYIIEGNPITFKVEGRLKARGSKILNRSDSKDAVMSIYNMVKRETTILEKTGDDDFSASLEGLGRFRVNAYRQKDTWACVVRTIPIEIPDYKKINIPRAIIELADLSRGIVLFTGTTGSGKSTSLSCLVDRINRKRDCHIVTVEDPIEYIHSPKKCVISQREVENDTESFETALRAAMRQAPDVVLLGEMRDYQTISAAITAAETGHLVFSTLHTMGAASTIDRIIDVFPSNQQNQIRTQLSMVLQAVVSQQLVPTLDGKLCPAFEIMVVNGAIRNLIRDGKTFQIDSIIQTSASSGNKSMDMYLYDLYKDKKISGDTAISCCMNIQILAQRMGIKAV